MSAKEKILNALVQDIMNSPTEENIARIVHGAYQLGANQGAVESILSLEEFVDIIEDDNGHLVSQVERDLTYDKDDFVEWLVSSKDSAKAYNKFGKRVSKEVNDAFSHDDKFYDILEDLYSIMYDTYLRTYPPF